jgi:hypothetical protein
VVKESTEEIVGRDAESTLKEREKHHNLIRIGCCDVFPSGRMPLQHDTVWEKAVHNEFCESHFHPRGMTKTGASARRPWLGRNFVTTRDRRERGGRDHEKEGEKWWRHEKWLGLIARCPFLTAARVRGHATVHWFALKIMDQRSDLTQR